MGEMLLNVPCRPVLYTDTVGGEQTCRDDLWAVSTDDLNALREKLAAAERERDEAQAAAGFSGNVTDALEQALAASQAEAAALREACRRAISAAAHALPWIPKEHSGTRQIVSEAMHDAQCLVTDTPASTDALREFGVRVAIATLSDCHAQPDMMYAKKAAAIVARVLAQPDAGQPEGEA